MTLHRIEVPNSPEGRVAALLVGFREAPLGVDIELMHGVVEMAEIGITEAIVIKVDGFTYALTMDEVELCAVVIEAGLRAVPDAPDRSMSQLLGILRYAQRGEGHGDHHLH